MVGAPRPDPTGVGRTPAALDREAQIRTLMFRVIAIRRRRLEEGGGWSIESF